MDSRQRGREAPRQPFGNVTNVVPAGLQEQITTYQTRQLKHSSSIYHELLKRTSRTTRDEHSIRFLDIVFKKILHDIDGLKWHHADMKSSGLRTIKDELSVAVERLDKLWALRKRYDLCPEVISCILSFLTPEPYDALAPSAIAVAQVNKTWRTAALRCRNLWTRPVITNHLTDSSLPKRKLNRQCAERVKVILERSGGEPLEIRLSFPSFGGSELDPVWATQIVLAVLSEAKRWAKASISLTPNNMAALNRLKADHLRILQKLSLTMNIAPGDAEREMDGVRALRTSLLPRLGQIRFQGFEPLATFSPGDIVDDTLRQLTVQQGADLRPFTLPKLQHVHIVRKDNPTGCEAVGGRTPSTSQLSSVHTLIKRSSTCGVRSLSLTNPGLSIDFLMAVDETFPGLRTLRIKMNGAYDPRIVDLSTVMTNTDWLPSLTTLALWIQSTDTVDYEDTRNNFFTDAFLTVLRSRAGKRGELKELALFPAASMLVNKNVLTKLKALKSLKLTRLEEFS